MDCLTPDEVPSPAGTIRTMDWTALLDEGMARFAGVLEEGDPAADVPACPGWSLADVGAHLRTTHRCAAVFGGTGRPYGTDPKSAGSVRRGSCHVDLGGRRRLHTITHTTPQ